MLDKIFGLQYHILSQLLARIELQAWVQHPCLQTDRLRPQINLFEREKAWRQTSADDQMDDKKNTDKEEGGVMHCSPNYEKNFKREVTFGSAF